MENVKAAVAEFIIRILKDEKASVAILNIAATLTKTLLETNNHDKSVSSS